ncbi:class I SAM-dependent methyltransferase [Luteolibacter sp. LG18]|uniref:class I SAM-dependent methyltransferase n=1 Tax=Luteolibacter sp. LG18 TaxID=2819286 RepID=UPI002B2D7BCE|nr:rRNA methyltransferase [Luteolibacter sp. LG18]
MTTPDHASGWANPPRPTELAHRLLEGVLKPGDHAIDATCGNGHDTLFLARQVGAAGRVLAFDVQAAAIGSARHLVEEYGVGSQVSFVLESHARLAEHTAPGACAAVMFNLGYLPGADREVITRSEETLPALAAATVALRPGGWLCVVCYPGHRGGDDEAAEVERWMEGLTPSGWRVARYGMLGTRKPAPFLLVAVKPG